MAERYGKRQKQYRNEDRSYGADYGRGHGDDWSSSYSRYDHDLPTINYRGAYESDEFYTRRLSEPNEALPAQGRTQGGFGSPRRARRVENRFR